MRRVLIIVGASAAVAGVLLFQGYQDIRPASSPDDRFSGGGGDGYDEASVIQLAIMPPEPSPRFSGSACDGYADSRYITSEKVIAPESPRFSGGVLDGFSACQTDQYTPAVFLESPRFSGGSLDGFASAGLLISAMGDTFGLNRFSGGYLSGYSSIYLVQSAGYLPSPPSPRYSGGMLNGDDSCGMIAPISSIALDSDHNLLPDWWEVYWYEVAGLVSSSSDTDGDGASAFDEYLAGTDPTRSNSIFRIASMAQGANGVALTCMAIGGRLYTVQFSDNLAVGSWSNIPALTRLTYERVGELSMPVGTSTNSRAFRVLVEFP